ncbi:hypothetical protein [Paenibacillus larvae]|uniref:hypothetical protein n=1 Tax=Paenibacillus larvae TaxID=1464 RepID=UPI00122E56C2|nr:hypothetical protein [Paenibacillus larvae]MCY7521939.1 hypothetical protein [Paenibacillus larvae]MCY9501574.1 hypothetical protein [Paenibacillus larvae]MCY9681048.1 hypothetical protein [Paenibacillus larvae]MCY9746827.1 hypothetical protein [Paenibacillus larvae]MCY9751516.1 hypothetical protein [Paenibacillus larvae]
MYRIIAHELVNIKVHDVAENKLTMATVEKMSFDPTDIKYISFINFLSPFFLNTILNININNSLAKIKNYRKEEHCKY